MRVKDLDNGKGNIKCCLCSADAGKYGHNPEPLVEFENGRCCDDCNYNIVLPYRLLAYSNYDKFKQLKSQLIEQGVIPKSKQL